MNKSILAGLTAAACWGFSNVLSKCLLAHFAPLSLLAIQLTASNIFLWSFLAFKKRAYLSKLESLKCSLPGILQPGLAFAFSVFGLNLTTANNEALIWAIETIVIIFFASLLLRERINYQILLLAILGTLGTLMSITSSIDALFDRGRLFGNIFILVGVFCAAFYSIYAQRQLINVDPLRLTALHQLAGLILVINIWLFTLPIFGISTGINSSEFVLAIISGITAYALPFFLYLITIQGIGAAKTSIFLILPPIFTIFGSFIVFKDQLNYTQWIGVIMALSAVSGICLLKGSKINESLTVQKTNVQA